MKKILVAMAAMVAGFSSMALAAPYKAVTATNLTPYSRGADLEMPGFNHELVQMISERSGVAIEIEYVPWKRAQKMAQKGSNVLIFGITRNAKREPLYEWVTHLLTNETAFLTTGDAVNSLEDAQGLGSVGAFANRYRNLVDRGWTNVSEAEDATNYKKLAAGRLDAVWSLTSRAVFAWEHDLGLDPSQLTVGASTGSAELWLAASPGFPADDAKKIAEAYQAIRADGAYDALFKRYFGDLPQS